MSVGRHRAREGALRKRVWSPKGAQEAPKNNQPRRGLADVSGEVLFFTLFRLIVGGGFVCLLSRIFGGTEGEDTSVRNTSQGEAVYKFNPNHFLKIRR